MDARLQVALAGKHLGAQGVKRGVSPPQLLIGKGRNLALQLTGGAQRSKRVHHSAS
ncbi:MAG: hypothetical protein BroJett021_51350 [Chloroflexota bacterium]|nr:MAG: hypothetical protein BroJett021_51350 [Chloroflexota bacterium]